MLTSNYKACLIRFELRFLIVFPQMTASSDSKYRLNPQAPVAQKIADEVVFDVSKVKESSFF